MNDGPVELSKQRIARRSQQNLELLGRFVFTVSQQLHSPCHRRNTCRIHDAFSGCEVDVKKSKGRRRLKTQVRKTKVPEDGICKYGIRKYEYARVENASTENASTNEQRWKTHVLICNGGKRKYSNLKSILKSLRFSSLAFSVDPLSVDLDQFTCTVPDRCYAQEIGLMLDSSAEGPGFKNRRRDVVE